MNGIHRVLKHILHSSLFTPHSTEIFDMLDKQDCRLDKSFFDNTAESMSVRSHVLSDIFRADGVGSRKGRMADALAHGGDEGRDKLRKSAVRCK